MTYEEKIVWYEVKARPLTDEEKDQHPTWDMIVEGAIPDEDEEILIATKNGVFTDTCLYDYDEGFYLDSGKDWDEILAWASIPRYKKNV